MMVLAKINNKLKLFYWKKKQKKNYAISKFNQQYAETAERREVHCDWTLSSFQGQILNLYYSPNNSSKMMEVFHRLKNDTPIRIHFLNAPKVEDEVET